MIVFNSGRRPRDHSPTNIRHILYYVEFQSSVREKIAPAADVSIIMTGDTFPKGIGFSW